MRALTPVTARAGAVDFLRGVAVLGIVLVNVHFFAHPVIHLVPLGESWGAGPGDAAARVLLRVFVEGKFYTLFSFLFGLGFALQLTRATARGAPFVPVYRRRLLVLLGIGALHVLLLSPIDVLIPYALFGFLLLALRDRSDAFVKTWIVGALALPVILAAGAVAMEAAIPADENALVTDARDFHEEQVDAAHAAYGAGSVWDAFRQRLLDYAVYATGIPFWAPVSFGMFLAGFFAGRRGYFMDVPGNARVFRRALAIGLPLGLVGNVLVAALEPFTVPLIATWWTLAQTAAYVVGVPALCFAYVAGLTLLFHRFRVRTRPVGVQAVGRMALTNYLLQSLVLVLVFHAYGLGRYGQVGVAEALGIAALVYAGQIVLSTAWLARYRYGPAEWVWRALTYGERIPLRGARADPLIEKREKNARPR